MTTPSVCLGKLPPKDDARTLQLAHYLTADLPTPPRDVRWGKPLPGDGLGMMGNDTYGDCTCATAGHMIMVWTANNNGLVTPSDQDVEAMYWATGDGQDDGRACVDVLNYWRQTGLADDKIEAYIQVNVKNQNEIQTALWLFGGLYIGVALPVSAQGQRKWTVVGDPNNDPNSQPGSWGGHAIPIVASIPHWGYTCITWGAKKGMTFNFWNTYVDECYAVLSQDWVDKIKNVAPNGFDFATLQADLSKVTG